VLVATLPAHDVSLVRAIDRSEHGDASTDRRPR
jgi:hypothetical protein